jgi:deoxyribodipyrimidine photo-lyase
MTALFWFRRDLRLQDNVALNEAIKAAVAERSDTALAYCIDPAGFARLSGIRQHSLVESARALNASVQDSLIIRNQPPMLALVDLAKKLKLKTVFATRAFDPDGVAEQNSVGLALQEIGVFLSLHDSNYAIAPGTILKGDGTPYRVYTPFFNNWFLFGYSKPFKLASNAIWHKDIKSDALPKPTAASPIRVIAGEEFALRTLKRFEKRALFDYQDQRNRADLSGTSHLSHALAHGEIHPRTILARLGDSAGHNVFRKEIAWREFYADVLWHNPNSLSDYYEPRFKKMRYDSGAEAKKKLAAWQQGQTGFPMVDAGMRQLATTGWMHNRVRMIVASFLVKDLHLEWTEGAEWFEQHLTDFDPASNSHGWQWTAGCGTDASPYYRVFNPTLQGLKFDPNGDYVRKYIPELRHIDGAAVHEPSLLVDGLVNGYPAPIVDHSIERQESLARLEEIKS